MKTIDFFKKSWEQTKKESKKDFSNEIFYSKFFLQTFLIKNEGKKFFIVTPNHFTKEVIEKDYINILEEKFSSIINAPSELLFITENEKDLKEKINDEKNNIGKNNNLIDKLSFENLIVGKFNQNAYKAIQSIIDNDSKKTPWNVIFLYGQTGVGKTHLINATGLKFLEKFPEKNVLYLTTEDFLRKAYNALSISGNEIEKFKDQFNEIDLLLIDDIQFLSNKDKLNEIFFNIFNNLINKKIVMTSDKLPENLKIDERMISRFNSGLSIKINTPDIETIIEIIKLKIKNSNRKNEFTSGAINYIANRSNNDIRRLEGLLNRIIFFSLNSMEANELINEQKIKEILDGDVDLFSINNNYRVSPQAIIETICSNYNTRVQLVTSKQRNQSVTFVRKVCMYVLREKLSLSYNEIGSFFSNRNHATVIDSCKYIEELIKTDENLKNYVSNIIEKL